MRRRKAERCVLKAEAALEAGSIDEARVALDEARRLDSSTLSLEEMQARLAARVSIPPEPVATERRRRWWTPAGAAALIALAAFGGWSAMRRPATPPDVPPASAHRADVILPAPGLLGTPPDVMVKTELMRAEIVNGDVAAPTAPAVLDADRPAPPVMRAADRPAAEALTPVNGLNTPPPEPESTAPRAPEIPVTPLAASNVPVNVPAAAAPSAPPSIAPPPPAVDEVARVRSVLAQYENAYTSLDASAARAVWPSVDERALTRAFGGLQSQQLSLGRCDVAVKGATARANCLGRATWRPKVGNGRSENRQWDFTLQNAGGTWKIVNAQAR